MSDLRSCPNLNPPRLAHSEADEPRRFIGDREASPKALPGLHAWQPGSSICFASLPRFLSRPRRTVWPVSWASHVHSKFSSGGDCLGGTPRSHFIWLLTPACPLRRYLRRSALALVNDVPALGVRDGLRCSGINYLLWYDAKDLWHLDIPVAAAAWLSLWPFRQTK